MSETKGRYRISQHKRFTLPDGRVGELGRCRSCKAEIVWVENPVTGKRPPYDLDGKSHFATCPDSGKWRGRSATPRPPSSSS